MNRVIRLALMLVVMAFILYVRVVNHTSATTAPVATPTGGTPVASTSPTPTPAATIPTTTPAPAGVPEKAVEVLKTVRTTGQPPDGYVGGRVFENREGHLPADGDYREFDVDPHNGQRNAERLIVEWKTKKAWYTGDHYQTFIEVP